MALLMPSSCTEWSIIVWKWLKTPHSLPLTGKPCAEFDVRKTGLYRVATKRGEVSCENQVDC